MDFGGIQIYGLPASWVARGGPAFFAYSTNYLIDLKAGIIVDVDDEEGTARSFRGVRDVIEARGLFSSFYSDRGSHR